jgi:hypothetical protein
MTLNKIPSIYLLDGFFQATLDGNIEVMKSLLSVVDYQANLLRHIYHTDFSGKYLLPETAFGIGRPLIDNPQITLLENSYEVYQVLLLGKILPAQSMFIHLIRNLVASNTNLHQSAPCFKISDTKLDNFFHIHRLFREQNHVIEPDVATKCIYHLTAFVLDKMVASDANTNCILTFLNRHQYNTGKK